jgi:hypothetical protein
MEKNQPVKKVRAGAISVSIFENAGKGRNGEATTFSSVVLQKRYKDQNGDWQTSGSLNVNDLPKAALLLQEAYRHLVLKQAVASNADESSAEEDIIEEVI